jgi:hypothetical protein
MGMVVKVFGVGGRPWSRPERPPERASSKAGDRATRGCSSGARTILRFASNPRPSSRGDSDKGKEGPQHPPQRVQAASRANGEGTAGVVDPNTGEAVQERSPLVPAPSAHRSTAQGG